jgi:hypothetical protein
VAAGVSEDVPQEFAVSNERNFSIGLDQVMRPSSYASVEASTVGAQWYAPTAAARKRIANYERYRKLLDVRLHKSLFQVVDSDTSECYIPIDFPGMLARLMRHYVVSPGFRITAVSGGTQPEIDRILEANDFVSTLRETTESLPAYGDAVLRVDLVEAEQVGADDDKLHAHIRYVHPSHFHPELDPLDARKMIGATLAWTFPAAYFEGKAGIGGEGDDRMIVLRERFWIDDEGGARSQFTAHEWDGEKLGLEHSVEALFDDLDGDENDLGIDEIPLVFMANNREAGEFWGRSDFPRIEPIIKALEKRVAQLDEVLEKHARPKLIVPPGVIGDGEDGEGGGSVSLAKHFDLIEVDAGLMEKVIKPEYLTWDVQPDGIKLEIEKLEEYFFMVTETSPASFGLERDGSQVESARALRFKAHRTVNRVEDQRDPMGDAIRRAMRLAQKLEIAEGEHDYERTPIKVRWGDPIIEDDTQEATDYSALKAQGLVSIHRAVKDLHNLTDAEAEAERARILTDEIDFAEATAPMGGTGLLPGDELLGPEVASAPAVQARVAERVGVEAGSSALAAEPEKTADKEVVLNGAQVTALVSLVTSVAAGELQRESAIPIIVAAFGLSEEQANEILADAGQGFVPTGGGSPAPFER